MAFEDLNDTERRNNGSTDVTVVHASPDAPTVDIYVTAADAEALGNAAVSGISFGDESATLPRVANGDYRVRITPAAIQPVSIAAAGPEVFYDSGTLTIDADVTAVAVNSTKGLSPVSLLIWNERDKPVIPVLDNSAEVRIVHAVDSVAVDVFAGESLLINDFAFKDTTVGKPGTENGYFKVTAGSLDVGITTAEGSTNIPTLSRELTLERGESYTVIAAGNSSENGLIILTDKRDSSLTDSGEVRFVHASSLPAAAQVDIYAYTGNTRPSTTELTNVPYKANSGYLALDSDEYTVDITTPGAQANEAAALSTAVTVTGGSLQTAIVVGNTLESLSSILLNDCRNCSTPE